MGRPCQASLRWTPARAQVSGSLHASRRHLQPPSSHFGKRPRQLWLGRLRRSLPTKNMSRDAVEFIRRLLLHVLLPGLLRIRHFGFLANRVRKQKLIQCRALLAAPQPPISIDSDSNTTIVEDPHGCPICKLGRLIVIELFAPEAPAVQD